MPEHLQEYSLDETLREHITKLEVWLQQNGTFQAGIPGFDKCSSKDLEKHVAGLLPRVVALFNATRSKTEVRYNIGKVRIGSNYSTASTLLGRGKTAWWRFMDDERP